MNTQNQSLQWLVGLLTIIIIVLLGLLLTRINAEPTMTASAVPDTPQVVYVRVTLAPSNSVAWTEYQRGVDAYRRSDYVQAVTSLSQAIEAEPGLLDGYYYRGLSYNTLGMADQALVDFQQMIAIAPEEARSYRALGWFLMQRGDYAGAESYYLHANTLDPQSVEALSSLGTLYFSMRRYVDAEAYLSEAIKQAPDDPSLYVTRGGLYRDWGRLPEAASDFDRVLILSPGRIDMWQVFYDLGLRAQARQQHQLAVTYLTRSITLFDYDDAEQTAFVERLNHRATSYIALGHFDDAYLDYQQILELHPDNPQSYANLGAFYATIGDHAQAADYYDQAARIRG